MKNKYHGEFISIVYIDGRKIKYQNYRYSANDKENELVYEISNRPSKEKVVYMYGE